MNGFPEVVRHLSLNTAVVIMAWLALMTAAGCARSESLPAGATGGTPVVYVVNYPLQYFTERIAGAEVDVHFPAPAGEDPAFWRPGAEVIGAYQSADLIVLNGARYAKWIAMASLPASKMIDTSSAFDDRLISIEQGATHSHGPTGERAHSGTVSTTWLDFDLAIAQAQAVHDALVKLRPEKANRFEANFNALKNDLAGLDAQMTSIAQLIDDGPLVTSHPVYQYWARRYGLAVRSVMWEPDVVPDDRAISALKGLIAEHPATIMIWEGDPDPRSVQLLETLGLRSAVFDPCGNVPDEGDFMTVMKHNTQVLREALDMTSRGTERKPEASVSDQPPASEWHAHRTTLVAG